MKKKLNFKLISLGFVLMIALSFSACEGKKKGAGLDPKAGEAVNLGEILSKSTINLEKNYVLPRPIVIFALIKDALGTESSEKFGTLVEANSEWEYQDFAKQALNLGMRTADGVAFFVGGNEEALKKNAIAIEKLCSSLGIQEKIKDETNKIKTAVEEENLDNMDKLIDDLYSKVEYVFYQEGEDELAMFASLGAWIEAAYLTTEYLKSNYNEKVAKIIAQDHIVAVYSKSLDAASDIVKDNETLQKIKSSLPALKDLIATKGDAPISKENIDTINTILFSMKTAIEAQ